MYHSENSQMLIYLSKDSLSLRRMHCGGGNSLRPAKIYDDQCVMISGPD